MVFETQPPNFDSDIEVVALYLLNPQNKFLLLQRQPHKAHGNKWGLPAGKVDKGETPDMAVVREVFEETGIAISGGSLNREKTLFVQQDGYDILYHTFKLFVDAEPPVSVSTNEHRSYRWVTKQESLQMDHVHDLDVCNRIFLG